MLFQEICYRLGLVKFSFPEWRSAAGIGSVDISAVRDQQFRNRPLVSVRGSVQGRRTPMIVLVARVNISAEFQ